MIYHFQQFTFNSKNLILLKQGETVQLRVKEANILALLLRDPDIVISKNDILDNVWPGEVITEQPIFQNISRLRAIFGVEAIINHPKKGYQWKIPLIPPTEVSSVQPDLIVEKASKKIRNYIWVITLISVIVVFIFFFFSHTEPEDNHKKTRYEYALMSVNSEISDLSQAQVTEEFNQALKIHNQRLNKDTPKIITQLTYRELDANLEYILWDKLKEYSVDALVMVDISSKYQPLYLNLDVVGKSYHWHSELVADDMAQLLEQFQRQMRYIDSSHIFDKAKYSPKTIGAKLQLLHQQYPEDLTILSKISERNTDFNQDLLLAQQLESLAIEQNNLVYQAYAYKLQGRLYAEEKYFEKSLQSFNKASDIYSDNEDFENKISLADDLINLAYLERDYEKIKKVSIEAINLAIQIGDYKSEFWQNLYLSKMAVLFQNEEDKGYYFNRAEKVYKSRFFTPAAEVKFQVYAQFLARINKDKASLIAQLHRMLATESLYQGLPTYYKTRSQSELTQIYMKDQRFDDALSLFDFNAPLTSEENNLIAKIYRRSGRPELALDYAKKSYQESILLDDVHTALNAAVLLIQLSKNKKINSLIHKALYLEYIKDNASDDWLKQNKWKLNKNDLKILIANQ